MNSLLGRFRPFRVTLRNTLQSELDLSYRNELEVVIGAVVKGV